jgi:hypothetical protein
MIYPLGFGSDSTCEGGRRGRIQGRVQVRTVNGLRIAGPCASNLNKADHQNLTIAFFE